jgi:hypothetical protein
MVRVNDPVISLNVPAARESIVIFTFERGAPDESRTFPLIMVLFSWADALCSVFSSRMKSNIFRSLVIKAAQEF